MKKQRKIAFIVLLAMIISIFSVNVSALKIGDEIGNVLYTNIKTYIDNYRIPSYNINNKSAIILSDLANYGFDVVYSNATRTSTVTLNPNKPFTPITKFEDSNQPSGTIAFKYLYTDIKAIVNGKTVESFNIKGYLAIFFEDLGAFGTFSWDNAKRESKFVSNKPITGISLDKTSAKIKVDESLKLTATITPATVADKTVSWSSSNNNVATVDAYGNIKGIGAGSATITATSSNGLTAKFTLTVEAAGIAVAGIALDKSTLTLKVNEFGRLNASVSPTNATDKTITWTSSNSNVAQVVNGYVLGVSSGTATITATSVNGFSARCTVSVSSTGGDITEVRLDRLTETIKVNDTFKLAVTVYPTTAADRSVSWSSSNTNIATVDSTGNVKGINTGSATITATAAGGLTSRCIVTVESAGVAVTGVSISPSSTQTIPVDGFVKLTATVSPSGATNKNVTWKSANSGIATVVDGYVMGVTTGTTTITATSVYDITKYTSITVSVIAGTASDVTAVSISPSSPTVAVNASITLTPTVTAPSGSTADKSVTWKSSSPNVTIVENSNGTLTVKGITAGTATITATSVSNRARVATAIVTVAAVDVTNINLDKTSATIKAGEAVVLTASILPADATNKTVTWSSSDSSVATVNSLGVVQGIKAGTATITARSSNNLTKTCSVTVTAAPEEPSINEITGITLNYYENVIVPEGWFALTANVTYASGATPKEELVWTSSNTNVAQISASGTNCNVLNSGIEGWAVIVARSASGKVAAYCLVIVEAPASVVE